MEAKFNHEPTITQRSSKTMFMIQFKPAGTNVYFQAVQVSGASFNTHNEPGGSDSV